MPLRVIEIVAPGQRAQTIRQSLEQRSDQDAYVFWATSVEDAKDVSFKMVIHVQESESVLDKLENIFSFNEEYRVVVYPAEATLPRLPTSKETDEAKDGGEAEKPVEDKGRISREELYADVLDAALPGKGYLAMASLASLAAILGLYKDNAAVIIGAMVLAPLLGPNVGLCLAAALGDVKLLKASLKSLAMGVAACMVLSVAAGFLLVFPDSSQELVSRTRIGYSDVALALISGAAAIVSLSQGAAGSLVGVMVALALLPPLAACGVFLGMGAFTEAAKSGLLFAANVICLNLSGTASFLLQGIRPLSWREARLAKKTAVIMSVVWALLLLALLFLLASRKTLFSWTQ